MLPSTATQDAAQRAPRLGLEPAFVVVAAGVCAALHVGKLPPAIPALREALGISLVEAGFLLAVLQVAGMLLGLVFGALAEGLGARRSMLLGLWVQALASACGAAAHSAWPLMVLRACEGFGFLLVVLGAPALIRAWVAPTRMNLVMGVWGAYMPLAAALALLAGPGLIAAFGWAPWWATTAAISALMALWLAAAVPAPRRSGVEAAQGAALAQAAKPDGSAIPTTSPMPAAAAAAAAAATARSSLSWRVSCTLRATAPWWLALSFAAYASQWLAVVGFLPTIYEQAGISAVWAGVLTAAVALANTVGNVSAGRLLHAGVPAARLLRVGFGAMALCACLAFLAVPGTTGTVPLLPGPARYAAVLLFSGVGGLVPATLFALAVPATPREGSLSVTVGWIQQWSAAGQFAGPPLVAWVAAAVSGWHMSWVVTGTFALLGLALSVAIGREGALQRTTAPDQEGR